MTPAPSPIAERLANIHRIIQETARAAGRDPTAITLLAVSKTRPVTDLQAALAAGQRAFGENYLQDALPKIQALEGQGAEWHYIGPIQSNKTRPIAEHFHWVHSLADAKHAQRLNDQRPMDAPPLQVCLQVNISGEAQKSGLAPNETLVLAREIQQLPRLRLRGLMTLPRPTMVYAVQRYAFAALRAIRDELNLEGLDLDTLSMGMSADLEAAILEGSTLVRVGTAIFGPRSPHHG